MKKCTKCLIKRDIFEFNKKGKRADGSQKYSTWCKNCTKSYAKDHFQNNKKYYYEKSQKYRKKLANFLKEVKKELKCSKCEENHISCLDFHHLDPNKKDFAVSRAISYSKTRLLKEIEKCIVLCSNCHRKLHYSDGI